MAAKHGVKVLQTTLNCESTPLWYPSNMARRVSQRASSRKTPLNRQFYRRSELQNGTVVLTERAPSFKSLAIGVFVKGGSRHETKKQAGLAHFLEHMMFKGTEKRSSFEIARDVDLVGGDFNAMTTREYTAFHISLPSRSVDFALELLADLIKHSRFDTVEIERERQVILQEFAMTEEDPEEFIHDFLFEKAFGKHPIGRNILGRTQTVKKFSRDDVVEYFQRHYYSRNIIITLAGNVDHDAVVRKLNALLGDFRGKKKPLPRESMTLPKFKPGIHLLKKRTEQTHFVVACPSYPMSHEQRFAPVLLNPIIGGYMSSSLF
jgi:predicted Zn-dependent peptidase